MTKHIRFISVALTVMFPVFAANALVVENESVSTTGGVSVSGEVRSTGDSDASSEIRNVIRSNDSGANVNINIRTNSDGVQHATSVSRTLESNERMEVRTESPPGDTEVRVETTADAGSTTTDAGEEAAASRPGLERFTSLIEKIVNRLFTFWR